MIKNVKINCLPADKGHLSFKTVSQYPAEENYKYNYFSVNYGSVFKDHFCVILTIVF